MGSGAMSTLLGIFWLFFATNMFFFKFGSFIFFLIFCSCLMSLVAFAAMMTYIGPEGDSGDIVKCWQKCRARYSDADKADDDKPERTNNVELVSKPPMTNAAADNAST